MEKRELKHRVNGRVFPYTEELSKHPDMMLVIDGKITGEIDPEDGAGNSKKRTKSKYLYNPANGRIIPWCALTAKERPDLMGVDSQDEIPGYMKQPETKAVSQTIHDDEENSDNTENDANDPNSYDGLDTSGDEDEEDSESSTEGDKTESTEGSGDSTGDESNDDEQSEEVDITTFTKAELITFAEEEYNVELDMAMKKAEMQEAIFKLAEKSG